MIKRIHTLKRIGRFTEIKGGRCTAKAIAELNVVFGSNASGKSIRT